MKLDQIKNKVGEIKQLLTSRSRVKEANSLILGLANETGNDDIINQCYMLTAQYNTYRDRFIQTIENNPEILNKSIYALLNLLDEIENILNAKSGNPESKLNHKVRRTGLSSVEIRDNNFNPFPPEHWYRLAKRELTIHGISAYRTFDQKIEIIKEVLDKGVNLLTLILDPKSEAEKTISIKEKRGIAKDILQVIEVVQKNKLTDYENFKLKLFDFLPTYTSLVIDGDIERKAKIVNDKNGVIRIQPMLTYKTVHSGLVLQFDKLESNQNTPFDYFADDLRLKWEKASELK